MQDNTAEKDPWANPGNTIGNETGESTPEGLVREAKWNAAMADVQEFPGAQPNETSTQSTITNPYEAIVNEPISAAAEEAPKRDENIADASAIINYGLNAAAQKMSVESVIQAINHFVPNNQEDPIKQLFNELGIDTPTEVKNVAEESRATKPQENAFLSEDINAPNTINKSYESALVAIQSVKDLVAEVQTSPAYSELRARASSSGKGIFEYAVSKYDVPNLTALFRKLGEEKQNFEKANKKSASDTEKATENPTGEQTGEQSQTENQSSTTNSSPETDATASNGFKPANFL